MILMILGNIISGKLCGSKGAKLPILCGFILSTIGFLTLFILVHNKLPYSIMVFPLLLIGLAVALAMPALTVVIIGEAPKDKAGFASATFNTSRQLGSLLGVAIIGTVINMAADLDLGMNRTLIIITVNCIASIIVTVFFIKK